MYVASARSAAACVLRGCEHTQTELDAAPDAVECLVEAVGSLLRPPL